MSALDVIDALDIARELAAIGVPIGLARADGRTKLGFKLPKGWQHTKPDPSVVDRWKPGDALFAVMGVMVDAVDIDPRNGGDAAALNGTMPRSYGRAITPRGGTHDLIASLGVHTRDGVLPGVDVKAGNGGEGHGFVFIAPTVRNGGSYRWEIEPDLTDLLLDDDPSGAKLAALVRSGRKAAEAGPSWTGPDYVEMVAADQVLADRYVVEQLDLWRGRFEAAADLPEGVQDADGRGWEALARDAAWAIAKLAATPWTDLTEDAAAEAYADMLAILGDCPEIAGKWDRTMAKAAGSPVDAPPWTSAAEDFDPLTDDDTDPDDPAPDLADSVLAEWTARQLEGTVCWAAGIGWLSFDGIVWRDTTTDVAVTETVRVLWRARHRRELDQVTAELDSFSWQTDKPREKRLKDRAKALTSLLSAGKIRTGVGLVKGLLEKPSDAFDTRPELLSVGNGVVDLRTGELMPHDPELLITKTTTVDYVPGARHDDWDASLGALPPEVANWMQVRFGQAATGYMPDDDVLPVLKGGGSNGKSTIVEAVKSALGGHAVTVPDRLLLANASDHPTELTTLRGVRFALLEEAPEGHRLNVKRLKDVIGTPTITARRIREDNITWSATHSLMLTTNYNLVVSETDHGTWRRLALVKFPYRFRKAGEPLETEYDRPEVRGLRSRMKAGRDGRAEAVMAWVVEGARRWFENGQSMPSAPAEVVSATAEWRGEDDSILRFMNLGLLVPDPERHVLGAEVLEAFNEWKESESERSWSARLLSLRLQEHEWSSANGVTPKVVKIGERTSWRFGNQDKNGPVRAWVGLKWAEK